MDNEISNHGQRIRVWKGNRFDPRRPGRSAVLTIILALYFILDGISEVVAGIKLRPGSGWGWMLFGGIVSIWLGIMIWGQFPLSGVWAIGILLGIKLFFVGLIMVMGGSTLRSMTKG